MKKPFNREKLREFVQRRKINSIGLLVITLLSAVITIICALQRFSRTDVLAVVTLLLVLLCFVQEIKLRKSFRTIHAFKGIRKKKKRE